jgi:hypothetical protein
MFETTIEHYDFNKPSVFPALEGKLREKWASAQTEEILADTHELARSYQIDMGMSESEAKQQAQSFMADALKLEGIK